MNKWKSTSNTQKQNASGAEPPTPNNITDKPTAANTAEKKQDENKTETTNSDTTTNTKKQYNKKEKEPQQSDQNPTPTLKEKPK